MSTAGVMKLLAGALLLVNKISHPRVKIVDSLSYEDAIRYFVESKPNDTKVVKGCLLIETHRHGFFTSWKFLDGDNNVLSAGDGVQYGRELIVKSIDDELKETFGSSKLLFVE
jgi:hypothetical protein